MKRRRGDHMKLLLVKLVVVLIGLAIFGYMEVWGAEQPDGFMGMRWGESIEQCKEKGLFVEIVERWVKDNITIVIGKGSSIGEIGVGVNYFFYNNKLFTVDAKFWGESDFGSLKSALIDKYGKSESIESLKNVYGGVVGIELKWEMPKVFINCKYNLVKKEGTLSYVYKPLLAEGRKERTKEL
jgi:hypothetical protein